MYAKDHKKMNETSFYSGHLNVHVRDHDRCITGYGTHDRVVAFLPVGDTLDCRVDHKWQLGMPTADQVLSVARKDQDVGGNWCVASVETNKESTYFTFIRKG